MTRQQIDRDRLRELAENAMVEPPWEDAGEWQTDGYAGYVVVSCEQDSGGEYDHVAETANERLGAFIAAADPNTVRALLDALDQAEADREWLLRSSRLAKEGRIKANARADQAEARVKAVENVLDQPADDTVDMDETSAHYASGYEIALQDIRKALDRD